MRNPTRARKQSSVAPTVEARSWPELADVLALVKAADIPLPYALEMSPLECDKALAVFAAWAIPSKERIGGAMEATPLIIDELYG